MSALKKILRPFSAIILITVGVASAEASPRVGVAVSTRALYRPVSDIEQAYTNIGLSAPPSINPSFMGRVFVQTGDSWRWGAGGGNVFQHRSKNDIAELRFSGAYGGLFGEYVLQEIVSHDVILGGLLGLGNSQLAYQSASESRRLEQDFFVFEPRIAFEFKIGPAPNWRAAAYLAYMFCFPFSKKTTGDVGVDRTVTNAVSLGVEILFGIFE